MMLNTPRDLPACSPIQDSPSPDVLTTLDQLENITGQLHACRDYAALLELSATLLQELLTVDQALLVQATSDADRVVAAVGVGAVIASLGPSRWPPSQDGRPQVWAIADRHDPDLSTMPTDWLTSMSAQAAMVCPVGTGAIASPDPASPQSASRPWGWLVGLQHQRPRLWSALERSLLKHLATQLGLALQRWEWQQQLQTCQHQEARWRAALEGAEEGVWDWQIDTNEVYFSPQWKQMLGYADDEIGNDLSAWDSRIHPDDRDRVYTALNQYLRGQTPTYQSRHRLRTQAGTWKWILDRGKAIAYKADGSPLRLIGTHVDITDRQQASHDLRQQKETLQTIINHLPVMIALSNQQGHILLVNPALERTLGWTLADWQRQDILEKCYPDPDYRQRVMADIGAASGQWHEWTTLTAAGQPLATAWMNIPLANGLQMGIGQNISDRQQKVTALQQAMAATEAANDAKNLFLANLSHELRTPLNVILGFAQLLRHDTNLTAIQEEALETMHRSGDHLLSLINEVLDLAKIESGHCPLEETGFDLIGLLHTLHQMYAPQAQAKGLTLEVEIDDTIPQYIIADAPKLRQILLNLLTNAIKFTPAGHVSFMVAVVNHDHTPSPPGPMLTLQFQVSDTGTGIAADELNSIFQPFVQAQTGRESMQGSGLGLAISKKLVELIGGQLFVSSKVGSGSTFGFTITAQVTDNIHPQVEHFHPMVVAVTSEHEQCRVLVVDDQPENRQLLVKLLQRIGLTVQVAYNGRDAIQQWRTWQPDLILMDIRMPELDGCEATRQIRQLEDAAPPVVIIAVTAQASHSDRALTTAAGCDDFITKPFQEATLFLKLSEHLGLEYIFAPPATSDGQPRPALSDAHCDPTAGKQFDLSRLPTPWLSALDDAAICGDDFAIYTLAEQLPPDFAPLAAHLSILAGSYQFEQILQLLSALADA